LSASAHDRLLELIAASELPRAEGDCLRAAADGPEALESLLGNGAIESSVVAAPDEPGDERPVFLEAITVEGFRGIGPLAQLRVESGPGLTIVVGRNGSGKSTFVEGLEVLLTGNVLRWTDKTKVWQQGWHNLHHAGSTHVGATFRIDGAQQPLEIAQEWAPGASFDQREPRSVSGSRTSWDELGWDAPLEQFRPILSYSELGTMFSSRAAVLYEALSSVLGLEYFDATLAVLRSERLRRERAGKDERRARDALRAELAASEDGRAVAAAALLGSRKPDKAAVLACAEDPDEGETEDLSALSALRLPDAERVAEVFEAASAAREAMASFVAEEGDRSEAIATILEQGLAFRHEHAGPVAADCPLCGAEQRLDDAWASRAREHAAELRERGRAYKQARSTQSNTLAVARHQLFSEETADGIAAASRCGLQTHTATALWNRWCELARPTDHEFLTKGPELALELTQAIADVQQHAAEEEDRRSGVWAPLRQAIVAWHSQCLLAEADGEIAATLKRAEAWLSEQLAGLRQERLAPVVDEAKANWTELQIEDDLSLGNVELKKQGTQRFVSFDVAIDGVNTSAFGVMSQGELSALAISVFLPRAMLPGSPFRFMVIDDPVQSLDGAKLDGLARVLARAAIHRQVIVFTHDERLANAVRRQAVGAHVLAVRRHARSEVEIAVFQSPDGASGE
jgi:ABC-type Mn2+/Zn2+ transport system ATPase subunit